MSMDTSSTVVSYWIGELPTITELHFKSFLFNNDLNFKYILYFDLDGSDSLRPISSAHPMLQSQNSNIQIKYFSLSKTMNKFGVAPFRKKTEKHIAKYVSYKKKTISSKWLPQIPNYNSRLRDFKKLHLHPELGFNFDHGQSFCNLVSNLTYRSDIFRSIIANNYQNDNLLYVDLDTCFTQPFSEYKWTNSFVSQWGTSNFANSAIMFLSAKDRTIRLNILKELVRTNSAWPWTLYSHENCEKYGLEIRGISNFDPAWTPGSPLESNSEGFFKQTPNLDIIVRSILEECFLVHWHNQWRIVPETGSPYTYFLELYR